MNRPLTYLGWPMARPTCLAASVAVLQLLAAPAHAQFLAVNTVRQTEPAEATKAPKTVLLKALLKQWESEYHATIFYESNLVDNKRVQAQETSGSLADKLAVVLPQVSLQFKELRDNYFVVTSRPEAAAGTTAAATAAPQNVPVSGR